MSIYTIDDVFGDERPGAPEDDIPTYVPAKGNWDPVGGICVPICGPGAYFIKPINASRVHSGTWHTTSMDPGDPFTQVSIPFTGIWVAAYILLPPYLGEYITSSINLTFVLDGDVVGTYERPTSLDADWTYNFTAFSSGPLSNTQHNLAIQPQPGTNASFLAFDYVAYEYSTSDSESTPSPIPAGTSFNSLPVTPTSTSSSSNSLLVTQTFRSISASPSPLSVTLTFSSTSISSSTIQTPAHTEGPVGRHIPVPGSTVIGVSVGCGSILLLGLLAWCLVRKSRNKGISDLDRKRANEYNSGDQPPRNPLSTARHLGTMFRHLQLSFDAQTARVTDTHQYTVFDEPLPRYCSNCSG